MLNVASPFVEGAVLWTVNWYDVTNEVDLLERNFWFRTFLVTRYVTGTLQLVSGIFLLIAVYKIRRFILTSHMANKMDHKSMSVHAVSFSAYNLAIVTYYAALFVFINALRHNSKRLESATRGLMITWTVVAYTNFGAQLCLIWICLKFRDNRETPKELPRETKALIDSIRCSVTRLETFEDADESDLQARQVAGVERGTTEVGLELQHYEPDVEDETPSFGSGKTDSLPQISVARSAEDLS